MTNFILGLFVGGICGFLVAGICAMSGRCAEQEGRDDICN